ncbi:MAG: M28 family peptidase [Rubripirellula sp.]
MDLRILYARVLIAFFGIALSSFCTTCFAEKPDSLAENSNTALSDPQLSQLQADIRFLASEELKGRSVADDTIHEAALYVANRMAAIGLDTDVIDGTPLQAVTVNLGARVGPSENNQLRIEIDEAAVFNATLDDGFTPMAIGSGSGEVDGPIAFAGYGITAPEFGYDDYAGIDATGATVLILRKEPQINDANSRFTGTRNTSHAFFATKIENAIQHGANAVILVNDPESVLQSVMNVRSKISQENERKKRLLAQLQTVPDGAINNRKTLNKKVDGADRMIESLQQELKEAKRGMLSLSDAGERAANKDSIPVVSVARDLIDQLLRKGTGKSLKEFEKTIDQTGAPDSRMLSNAEVSLQIELKPTAVETSNVIGVLPGRGELADETVIVGAHYDHVGMGGYGSLAPGTIAVHNGADDNASGTATMLATAKQMRDALAEVPSHRRVVFIAFTGEERGLIGSQHYVRNPRFRLGSTVGMVNLDMVGRLRDNELTVYGTGSGDSLDAMVEQANERQQFNLFKVPSGYGPSDHQSFYVAGVPVLFFFTGLHNDYHRPTDDFDKIDFGGLTRVTDIVSDVTFELATCKDRPKYVETENRVRVRRQLTAFMGVSLSDRDNQVVISGVSPGGPAERAGMRLGDRLDKLGGKPVTSSSDVLELMRNRSPGQKLTVRLSRDGEMITMTVELAKRPGG